MNPGPTGSDSRWTRSAEGYHPMALAETSRGHVDAATGLLEKAEGGDSAVADAALDGR